MLANYLLKEGDCEMTDMINYEDKINNMKIPDNYTDEITPSLMFEKLIEDKCEIRPSHYQGKIETIDYIKDKLTKEEYIGFLKGNVIKYISRAGKKGNTLDDLLKDGTYLNWLIDEYRNEN